MAIQFQFRRAVAAAWTSGNPVLAQGEMGLETDTNRFKIGTGAAAWNTLPYVTGTTTVATDNIWTAANQLVVSSGTNAAYALGAGTSGQVLTVMSGGALGWTSAATGGGGVSDGTAIAYAIIFGS